MALDREMLANDLAGVLSDTHGVDVDSDDVKRGLDAFLEAIKPADPKAAAKRVGAYLTAFKAHSRGSSVLGSVANDDKTRHLLRVADVELLVHEVGTETYVRSLREKLMDRGSLPLPEGVTPVACPTCHGRATLFEGIVQRHLKPSGLPCTGAGQAYKTPEATGE
jgi:hypothetical protein